METTLGNERPATGRVVGASAGGLAAVREVLEGLPSGLPAALVVVLHLMPDHPSYLAEILSRTSRLPVGQAEDGQNSSRVTSTSHPRTITSSSA
jgi:two-component system chemotaxis response regulator CheB